MSTSTNFYRVVKTVANPAARAEKGVKKPVEINIGFARPFQNGEEPDTIGYSLSLYAIPSTDAEGKFRCSIRRAKKSTVPDWDLEREVNLLDKEGKTIGKKKVGDLRFNLCSQRDIKRKDDTIETRSDLIGVAFFKKEEEATEEMDLIANVIPCPKFDLNSGQLSINMKVFMPKSDIKGSVSDESEPQEKDDEEPPF